MECAKEWVIEAVQFYLGEDLGTQILQRFVDHVDLVIGVIIAGWLHQEGKWHVMCSLHVVAYHFDATEMNRIFLIPPQWLELLYWEHVQNAAASSGKALSPDSFYTSNEAQKMQKGLSGKELRRRLQWEEMNKSLFNWKNTGTPREEVDKKTAKKMRDKHGIYMRPLIKNHSHIMRTPTM